MALEAYQVDTSGLNGMYLPPALDIANSASSLGGAAVKTANKIYENVSEYLKYREGTSAKNNDSAPKDIPSKETKESSKDSAESSED